MARRACDGDGLLGAFRAAVANLEAHVDEINALNVYPVPDGDTGSNMLATVKAALDEAEGAAGQPAERIAAAISFGALMGARGNSGVITSQIFRGMAEGLGGKSRFNGLDLAHALSQGAKTAYGAVAKPVEGTILTVIRESADAAVVAAERDNDIETVLARHPRRRREVRRADAEPARDPARGRRRRLGRAGPLPAVPGRAAAPRRARRRRAPRAPAAPRPARRPSTLVAHADEGFGYETMFLLQPNGSGQPLDVDAIRDHLESIGESVLVAGDSRALKVHVHNERPDLVIGYGLSSGALQPDQRREPRQPGPRRPRDAGGGVHGDADGAGDRRRERPSAGGHRGRGDADDRPRRRPTRCRHGLGGHRRRRRRRAGRDLPRLRGRARSSRAASRRTRARASCSRRSQAVDAPRGHRPAQQPERRPRRAPGRRRWPIGRSWSSRPATRPRASPRSWRSTRASTRRPTPAR